MESWSIGGREVGAESFVLILPPEAFVAFERVDGARAAVTEALRDVIEGPGAALRELFVVVALSTALDAWSTGYRHPPSYVEGSPAEPVVVATASAYLRARGDDRAADVLVDAVLERDPSVVSERPRLYRYVLRLPPSRLAALDADGALRDAVTGAIELATRRATERAASLELALLPEPTRRA